MAAEGKEPRQERARQLRQVAILTTIPVALLAGPLLGALIGNWLDKKFSTELIFTLIFVALGLGGAILQVISLIRQASKEDK